MSRSGIACDTVIESLNHVLRREKDYKEEQRLRDIIWTVFNAKRGERKCKPHVCEREHLHFNDFQLDFAYACSCASPRTYVH